MSARATLPWLLLFALCASACGSVRRSEPIAGPLELDSGSTERGRALYAQHCHKCHPGGEGGLGPALNDKPVPDFLKRFQVRHGLGRMPSFSDREISDKELDDILAYLKALRAN